MNMPHQEEEVQQQVETGITPNTIDARIYQQVFATLSEAPDYTLPPSFGATVLKKIQLTQQQSLRWEYFFLCVGILVMLTSAVILFMLSDFSLNLGFLKGLASYKWVIVFAALFVILLQWVDRKVLHAEK